MSFTEMVVLAAAVVVLISALDTVLAFVAFFMMLIVTFVYLVVDVLVGIPRAVRSLPRFLWWIVTGRGA